jgi:hypothetical protein
MWISMYYALRLDRAAWATEVTATLLPAPHLHSYSPVAVMSAYRSLCQPHHGQGSQNHLRDLLQLLRITRHHGIRLPRDNLQ